LGQPFLTRLAALFEIELLVAVGNKAEIAIRELDLPYQKVRHPSHGGKANFLRQLDSIPTTRSW
jgi:hypothetical protein